MKKILVFSVALWLALTGCSPRQSPTPTPGAITAIAGTVMPSTIGPAGSAVPFATPEPPTPIPTLPAGPTPTQLKYLVLDRFPDFFYCDPDFYPIARADETTLALERFPEIQAEQEQFQTILEHNGLTGLTTFTDEQKLFIYREHKKLAALYFELIGDGYQFQLQTGGEGTISGGGQVGIQKRDPSFATCPICLAAGSRIDTPLGPVPVEDLRLGDPVWTASAKGERLAATVLRVTHVPVPQNHRMVHLALSDGRELWASPGHPTADGRTVGELKAGDLLGGVPVVRIELVAYQGYATYDLLPSGGTGAYWVNGILMGSTLAVPSSPPGGPDVR